MKNKNLSWFAALLVFALLLWCTAATPGKIADPSTYTLSLIHISEPTRPY